MSSKLNNCITCYLVIQKHFLFEFIYNNNMFPTAQGFDRCGNDWVNFIPILVTWLKFSWKTKSCRLLDLIIAIQLLHRKQIHSLLLLRKLLAKYGYIYPMRSMWNKPPTIVNVLFAEPLMMNTMFKQFITAQKSK